MFTKQQTFDIVAQHLLMQGKKAMNEDQYCQYQSPDGCKCAAGILIPDDKYNQSLEGGIVDRYLGPKDVKITNLIQDLGHDAQLVGELQSIHDEKDVEDWPSQLLGLAESHGLDDTVVKTYSPANSQSAA